MSILQKAIKIIKDYFFAGINFLRKTDLGTKQCLSAADSVDILVSLSPVTLFGCMLFGWRAVLTIVVCIVVCFGTDILWDVIFKKKRKGINYSIIVTGLLVGLTLSSVLNVIISALLSVLTVLLIKTVFKKNSQRVIAPVLIPRILLAIIFFGAFSYYVLPFVNTSSELLPIDNLYFCTSYIQPAKYLFFGLHSGNIGETSVLLILIGGIYLMLRKIINPIIPISFILTVGMFSLIFGEIVSLSLLGGGLFFAAIFMTMDYGFKAAPRYKKYLYGVVCGILTFMLRRLFKTEAVLLAVLITDAVFFYFTRRNIKKVIRFIKEPDFSGLLKKVKKAFSV